MKFMVETSARHIHLTQESVEKLFGAGHQLQPRKNLSYPGIYACHERLTVVGPKRSIENISVLGPCRTADQVELSGSDARTLGIDAPIRESGHLAGSGACKPIGPAGEPVSVGGRHHRQAAHPRHRRRRREVGHRERSDRQGRPRRPGAPPDLRRCGRAREPRRHHHHAHRHRRVAGGGQPHRGRDRLLNDKRASLLSSPNAGKTGAACAAPVSGVHD